MRRLAFLALTLATGCSDALEKTSSAGQVIGVINAFDLSLFSATDFTVSTRPRPGTTAGPTATSGGSPAFVVALQDDSIAWIANRALNSVTRLNYFAGETTSVAAGVFPQGVVLVGSRVFVVNSNLVGGIPAGPSWLTSFECCGVRTPQHSNDV